LGKHIVVKVELKTDARSYYISKTGIHC